MIGAPVLMASSSELCSLRLALQRSYERHSRCCLMLLKSDPMNVL